MRRWTYQLSWLAAGLVWACQEGTAPTPGAPTPAAPSASTPPGGVCEKELSELLKHACSPDLAQRERVRSSYDQCVRSVEFSDTAGSEPLPRSQLVAMSVVCPEDDSK